MSDGVLFALVVLVVVMVMGWLYRKKLEADLAALYSSQQTSTAAASSSGTAPPATSPTPSPKPTSAPKPMLPDPIQPIMQDPVISPTALAQLSHLPALPTIPSTQPPIPPSVLVPPPPAPSPPASVAQTPTGNINPNMVGPWVMQMHSNGSPIGPPRDLCMAHDGSLSDTTGRALGMMTATSGGISLVLHGQTWPGHADGQDLVFPLSNGMVTSFTKTGATHSC